MDLETIVVNIIRTYFICLCTYYIDLKFTNKNIKREIKKIIIISISMFVVSIICKIVKDIFGFSYSVICMALLVGFIFAKNTKRSFVFSLLTTVISLSINYILFSISILIGFIINVFIRIQSEYINISIMILAYIILVYYFLKIKRFRKGLYFLQEKLKNEYIGTLILNISVIILFSVTILTNYSKEATRSLGAGLIIFSIILFVTIQESLQLYYKQKLLIQDLEETKKELENKKEEIKQLEKENLEFSKTSHSIAHKQKSLENKLNELILKNEIASEIDLKERINKISKEIYNKTAEIELTKTEIPEIDDMLKYMQSECSKNDIDFQLQLSGNIHHMINHHIAKEKLEILLADHIKNAIIAINYSDNINKSILVRMGIIDGNYGLYIYDSGIEFEIETLINLGEKPSTTHKESGGTGMGFMNTFDTLKASKASMTIKEYNKPCKDNFTKLIMIKFDDKNEFKICSYRAEEIKNEDIMKKLKIESI